MFWGTACASEKRSFFRDDCSTSQCNLIRRLLYGGVRGFGLVAALMLEIVASDLTGIARGINSRCTGAQLELRSPWTDAVWVWRVGCVRKAKFSRRNGIRSREKHPIHELWIRLLALDQSVNYETLIRIITRPNIQAAFLASPRSVGRWILDGIVGGQYFPLCRFGDRDGTPTLKEDTMNV